MEVKVRVTKIQFSCGPLSDVHWFESVGGLGYFLNPISWHLSVPRVIPCHASRPNHWPAARPVRRLTGWCCPPQGPGGIRLRCTTVCRAAGGKRLYPSIPTYYMIIQHTCSEQINHGCFTIKSMIILISMFPTFLIDWQGRTSLSSTTYAAAWRTAGHLRVRELNKHIW